MTLSADRFAHLSRPELEAFAAEQALANSVSTTPARFNDVVENMMSLQSHLRTVLASPIAPKAAPTRGRGEGAS